MSRRPCRRARPQAVRSAGQFVWLPDAELIEEGRRMYERLQECWLEELFLVACTNWRTVRALEARMRRLQDVFREQGLQL